MRTGITPLMAREIISALAEMVWKDCLAHGDMEDERALVKAMMVIGGCFQEAPELMYDLISAAEQHDPDRNISAVIELIREALEP